MTVCAACGASLNPGDPACIVGDVVVTKFGARPLRGRWADLAASPIVCRACVKVKLEAQP